MSFHQNSEYLERAQELLTGFIEQKDWEGATDVVEKVRADGFDNEATEMFDQYVKLMEQSNQEKLAMREEHDLMYDPHETEKLLRAESPEDRLIRNMNAAKRMNHE